MLILLIQYNIRMGQYSSYSQIIDYILSSSSSTKVLDQVKLYITLHVYFSFYAIYLKHF